MSPSIWHKPLLRETLLPAVLNSYSVVFFLNNRMLALVLLAVTFLNPWAGVGGLFSVLLAVALAQLFSLDKLQLRLGVLTFNSLLTGLAMGTFFKPGLLYFFLLSLSAILSLVLSVVMTKVFFRKGLPFLSLPFILTFWLVALTASSFEPWGLRHHDFFWLRQTSSTTLTTLYQQVGWLDFSHLPEIYLRSLSSILFQNNLWAGAVLAIALLLSSRINFLLSWMALLASWLTAQILGADLAQYTYYNIGANYMMLAFAMGGFFHIPSKSAYLWSVLLIPVTSVFLYLLNALSLKLPLYSLPFVLVAIGSVHLMRQRRNPKSLILTPVQLYSPESNLYTYQNDRIRYDRFRYVPLRLPFWGSWTVSQAYDGEHTHQGEWGQALDFMIYDPDGKTYHRSGLHCDDYHCFGKPVLAPADGTVAELIDQIQDNPIGEVNTAQNWGNSIVLCHYPGVYTQLSHLKQGSIKVAKGDFVRQGDILALCGNSGRSPQPHLHVQVQATPYIGSKTLSYPFSYYLNQDKLYEFSIPRLNETLSNLPTLKDLRKAFDFPLQQPRVFTYRDENGKQGSETWEAFTDPYNYKYLYCRETESVAYYYLDEGMFYFTAYYGSKTSLLYCFYLSAYKVFLGDFQTEVTDELPFSLLRNNWMVRSLNDFVAPFYQRVRVRFVGRRQSFANAQASNEFQLYSGIERQIGKHSRTLSTSVISIRNSEIHSFTYSNGSTKIQARCEALS